jgi:hypothetical protein
VDAQTNEARPRLDDLERSERAALALEPHDCAGWGIDLNVATEERWVFQGGLVRPGKGRRLRKRSKREVTV